MPKQSGNRCNLFLVVLPGLPALATACWSAAFLAYLAVYVPYLVAPRAVAARAERRRLAVVQFVISTPPGA